MQREKLFPLGLAYNLAFIIGISIRALILICNSNRMIAPHNILARHTKAVLICGTVNKLLTCCDLDSEHQELFIFLTKCWWMAHIPWSNAFWPTYVAGWSWHRVDTVCFTYHSSGPKGVSPGQKALFHGIVWGPALWRINHLTSNDPTFCSLPSVTKSPNNSIVANNAIASNGSPSGLNNHRRDEGFLINRCD